MWDLYEHAMIMSTLLNSAEVNNTLIEDEQKQSYSKKTFPTRFFHFCGTNFRFYCKQVFDQAQYMYG